MGCEKTEVLGRWLRFFAGPATAAKRDFASGSAAARSSRTFKNEFIKQANMSLQPASSSNAFSTPAKLASPGFTTSGLAA